MEQIRFEYSLFSFLQTFQKLNPKIYKTSPQQYFNDPKSLGLTYLTRLRVGLSHLREHKFRHNFRDSLNPIFNCSNVIESTKHYLFHCSNSKSERQSLLQKVRTDNPNLLSLNEDASPHLLLCADNTLAHNRSNFLLNSVTEYITSTKHFRDPLILLSKSNSTRRFINL